MLSTNLKSPNSKNKLSVSKTFKEEHERKYLLFLPLKMCLVFISHQAIFHIRKREREREREWERPFIGCKLSLRDSSVIGETNPQRTFKMLKILFLLNLELYKWSESNLSGFYFNVF